MGITGTETLFCAHIKGNGRWLDCGDGKTMPRLELLSGHFGGRLCIGLTKKVILVGCSVACLATLEKIEAQAYHLGHDQ